MVLQIPLTLDNWETLEQLGYEARAFNPNKHDSLTMINIGTNGMFMRASSYSKNFAVTSIEPLLAFALLPKPDDGTADALLKSIIQSF